MSNRERECRDTTATEEEANAEGREEKDERDWRMGREEGGKEEEREEEDR